MKKQLSEKRYPEAIQLINDIVSGIASIEHSISPVFEYINNTELVELQIRKVLESLDRAVISLDGHSYGTVEELLQSTLITNVKKLKAEMETLFEPYLVS